MTLNPAPDRRGQLSDPAGEWQIYDLAPQILKLAGRLLGSTYRPETRARLEKLIDGAWTHMRRRCIQPSRIGAADSYAWDDWARPPGVTEPAEADTVVSWYITERMVEAMVAVEQGQQVRTAHTTTRIAAREMVSEVRWLVLNRIGDPDTQARLLNSIGLAEKRAADSPALCLALAIEVASELGHIG